MFHGFKIDHRSLRDHLHDHLADRFLEKGDFKYLVLELLKEKPSYGYEIIRALEEKFLGFYTPSAGAVYPTLQMFEELGYVTVTERDGKKVYTITEEGKEFLANRADVMQRIHEQMTRWWGPGGRIELYDALHDLKEMQHLIRRQARQIDGEKQHQIRLIISRTAQEINELLGT